MTILADSQIQQLCVPPETIFDAIAYEADVNDPQRWWPLSSTAQAIIHEQLIEKHTRPITDEERAAFVPMIEPFHPTLIREVERDYYPGVYRDGEMVYADGEGKRKIISRGLTSYGYDVSLCDSEVKFFTNVHSAVVDPKRPNPRTLVDAEIHYDPETGEKFVILPGNSYLLGVTKEYFRMPRNVIAVCLGKSTYARVGAIVNVTPIEPGFEGQVVIEIGNSTPAPMRIYLNEGIAQFLFLRGEQACKTSYGDRGGKYMGQTGVTLAKV